MFAPKNTYSHLNCLSGSFLYIIQHLDFIFHLKYILQSIPGDVRDFATSARPGNTAGGKCFLNFVPVWCFGAFLAAAVPTPARGSAPPWRGLHRAGSAPPGSCAPNSSRPRPGVSLALRLPTVCTLRPQKQVNKLCDSALCSNG